MTASSFLDHTLVYPTLLAVTVYSGASSQHSNRTWSQEFLWHALLLEWPTTQTLSQSEETLRDRSATQQQFGFRHFYTIKITFSAGVRDHHQISLYWPLLGSRYFVASCRINKSGLHSGHLSIKGWLVLVHDVYVFMSKATLRYSLLNKNVHSHKKQWWIITNETWVQGELIFFLFILGDCAISFPSKGLVSLSCARMVEMWSLTESLRVWLECQQHTYQPNKNMHVHAFTFPTAAGRFSHGFVKKLGKLGA